MPTITVPKIADNQKNQRHFLVFRLATVLGKRNNDKNPTAAIVSCPDGHDLEISSEMKGKLPA
jgi:hypothetical protein